MHLKIKDQPGKRGTHDANRLVARTRRLVRRLLNHGIGRQTLIESVSMLALAQALLFASSPNTLAAQDRPVVTLEFPVEPSLRHLFPLPVRDMDQPVGEYPTGGIFCDSLGVPCGEGSAIVLLDLQGLSTIIYARSPRFPDEPDLLIVNTQYIFEKFEILSRDKPPELEFNEEYEPRYVPDLDCNDQGALWKIRATAMEPLFEVSIQSWVSCYEKKDLGNNILDSIANPIASLVTTKISIERTK